MMPVLRRRASVRAIPTVLSLAVSIILPLSAEADWTNAGGNAGRNCRTSAIGPTAADERWSGGAPSIIAWQPVIEGNRLFVVGKRAFHLAANPTARPSTPTTSPPARRHGRPP